MSDSAINSYSFKRRDPASWLPMLVGGLVATLAISGSMLFGKWHRQRSEAAPAPRPGRHRKRERESLAKLRRAIVGNDRDAIVKVLGPPPTTSGYRLGSIVQSGEPEYYRADTWYYPMDPVRQRAIAVEFDDGVAREAQIIEVPAQ
jgi:hypothetical protein